MKVKGNIQSVQSDLDFCIKITSTGKIKTVDKLRRHFFSIFMEEERERLSDLLEEKKLKDLERVELERVEAPEPIEEIEWVETTDFVESEESKENKELEEETEEPTVNPFKDSPFTKSFFQHKVEPFTPESYKEEEQVYVGGIDLDEEDEDVTEDNNYVSHGIDLDSDMVEEPEEDTPFVVEYVQEEDEEDTPFVVEYLPEEDEVEEPTLEIPVGYASHGLFIDEEEFEESTEGTEEEVNDFITYEEPEELEPEEVEEVETTSIEEDYLAFRKSLETNKEERERRRKRREELRAQAEAKWASVEQPVEKEPEVPLSEPEWFSTEIEEVTSEPIVFEVTKNEEPTDAPKDIRDFLRQHPNSDINFVAKFYSMKEIEKQIKLGRVYKKKGKLMI